MHGLRYLFMFSLILMFYCSSRLGSLFYEGLQVRGPSLAGIHFSGVTRPMLPLGVKSSQPLTVWYTLESLLDHVARPDSA